MPQTDFLLWLLRRILKLILTTILLTLISLPELILPTRSTVVDGYPIATYHLEIWLVIFTANWNFILLLHFFDMFGYKNNC